jgi:hypothetical protein
VKDTLLKESNKHDTLHVVIQLVCDDLELVLEQGMSLLVTWAVQIVDQVHEMARHALHFCVQRSFAIIRSHYENINLSTISQGFAPSYTQDELEEIEEMVAPLRRTWLEK